MGEASQDLSILKMANAFANRDAIAHHYLLVNRSRYMCEGGEERACTVLLLFRLLRLPERGKMRMLGGEDCHISSRLRIVSIARGLQIAWVAGVGSDNGFFI